MSLHRTSRHRPSNAAAPYCCVGDRRSNGSTDSSTSSATRSRHTATAVAAAAAAPTATGPTATGQAISDGSGSVSGSVRW
jgi:hypothetical protein